ncbi:MAG: PLP-dependent aminotransferase family protein, partial [Solirubrobacterales bacterium]
VPGAAAYVDGRGGSDMRLNFSASPPEEIREGIKRIGNVIAEQVQLYESITSDHRIPGPSADPAAPGREADEAGGTSIVVPFRREGR